MKTNIKEEENNTKRGFVVLKKVCNMKYIVLISVDA